FRLLFLLFSEPVEEPSERSVHQHLVLLRLEPALIEPKGAGNLLELVRPGTIRPLVEQIMCEDLGGDRHYLELFFFCPGFELCTSLAIVRARVVSAPSFLSFPCVTIPKSGELIEGLRKVMSPHIGAGAVDVLVNHLGERLLCCLTRLRGALSHGSQ